MAPPRKRRRPLHPIAVLIAVAFLVYGISTISGSAHNRTETVTAQVNARANIPFSHRDLVEFHFADGSDDDVSSNDSQSLFDAVDKFGPGTARVTRTTSGSHSIHSVEFGGKTYDIGNQIDDRVIGIIAVVLGALVLGWAILDRYITDPDDAGAAAKSGA